MTIHYSATADDYGEWAAWYYTNMPTGKQHIRKIVAMWWGLCVFICVLSVMMMHDEDILPIAILSTVEGIVCILVYFWMPKGAVKDLRKRTVRLLSRPEYAKTIGPCSMSIDGEGVTTAGESATLFLKWRVINRIEATQDQAYLVIGPGQAYVIPRAKIEAGNFDEFVAEARVLHQRATAAPTPIPLPAM